MLRNFSLHFRNTYAVLTTKFDKLLALLRPESRFRGEIFRPVSALSSRKSGAGNLNDGAGPVK